MAGLTTIIGVPIMAALMLSACGGRGSPHSSASAGHKNTQLALAQCMRAHGVPSWGDPTFPAGGGVMMGGPSNPSQRTSPAVLKALQTCNRLVGL
jgi:hypothetical protein